MYLTSPSNEMTLSFIHDGCFSLYYLPISYVWTLWFEVEIEIEVMDVVGSVEGCGQV